MFKKATKPEVVPLHLVRFLPPIQRFRQLVIESSGCWGWRGSSKGSGGYPMMRVNGKKVKAHRFSYELSNGPIPEGYSVCHTCDNPACTNPAHLIAAPHWVNMLDRAAKGRSGAEKRSGERCGQAKLTAQQVLEIREKFASGSYTKVQLGKEYGVTDPLIGKIVSREIWKYV